MDCVDKVTYNFELDASPEATRQAFVNLFDPTIDDACLVMRHLTLLCKWQDQTEYNDPIIEAKMNSLRGVIREIKKQLNMKPIQEIDDE